MRPVDGDKVSGSDWTQPRGRRDRTRASGQRSGAEGFAEQAARIGFICSMLFFACAALYGFWLSGQSAAYLASAAAFADGKAADLGYRIEILELKGARQTPKGVVEAALRLPHPGSIFSYDTAAARERLLGIGWIETADVRRNTPSKLEVAITERTPFARFLKNGKIYVIDRDGRNLGEDADNAFSHLFLTTGEGADAAASSLIDGLVLTHSVGARVKDAELVAGRFWTIKLVNGFEAKLPRKVTALSLSRLDAILGNEKVNQMPIETIDLRLPHRTILQLKNATAELRDKTIAELTASPAPPEASSGRSRPL